MSFACDTDVQCVHIALRSRSRALRNALRSCCDRRLFSINFSLLRLIHRSILSLTVMDGGHSARRKPTFRLTPPTVLEHPLQAQITKLLTIEIAPPGKVSKHGVLWFSIDHANFAGEVPGVRIGRGIVAGIPDMFVLYRGWTHFIELKTTNGELSLEQQSVASAVVVAGGRVGVATRAEEVLACLDTWKVPRHRRTTL